MTKACKKATKKKQNKKKIFKKLKYFINLQLYSMKKACKSNISNYMFIYNALDFV